MRSATFLAITAGAMLAADIPPLDSVGIDRGRLPPEPRKTRAERRKGMARTSPEVVAKREARRRIKAARRANRSR